MRPHLLVMYSDWFSESRRLFDKLRQKPATADKFLWFLEADQWHWRRAGSQKVFIGQEHAFEYRDFDCEGYTLLTFKLFADDVIKLQCLWTPPEFRRRRLAFKCLRAAMKIAAEIDGQLTLLLYPIPFTCNWEKDSVFQHDDIYFKDDSGTGPDIGQSDIVMSWKELTEFYERIGFTKMTDGSLVETMSDESIRRGILPLSYFTE